MFVFNCYTFTMKNALFSLTLLLLAGCGPSSTKTDKPNVETIAAAFKLPYDLAAPDETTTLPNALKEVSGLTYYKDDQLLCVQDEDAVVYVFDTKKQKVVYDFGFGGKGDFEGIEYVNGEVYVLESNGNLYRFAPPANTDPVETEVAQNIRRTQTDLPAGTEVEGLGYEPKTKRLLIAVKKGGGQSSDRAIYSFDLLNRAVFKDMQLNEEQLNGAGVDPKTYKPSGIAVHPLTGEWYVLTSAGKRLLITNRQGQIVGTVPLDPKQFRQPEGICFAPNGDLFIASEGDGKKGSVMRFGYKR